MRCRGSTANGTWVFNPLSPLHTAVIITGVFLPSEKPKALRLRDATIGVITAVPHEFTAVREVFGATADPVGGIYAPGMYALAEIPSKAGGTHVVAVTLLPEYGNNAAAIRTNNL